MEWFGDSPSGQLQFSRNFSHLPPPPPELQHCLIAARRSRSCESRPRSHTYTHRFAGERRRSRNYVNSHTRTGESARQVGAVKASASAAAPASSHTEPTWKRLEVANRWQIIIQYWFAAISLAPLDRLVDGLPISGRPSLALPVRRFLTGAERLFRSRPPPVLSCLVGRKR